MRASHKAKAGKATCFCTVPSGRSAVPWRRAEWLRRRPSEPQVSGPSQKVPPLVTKQEKDVVVAARIPRSRARGESPAGRWHARPQAQRRGCGHGREPGLTSAQSAALGWPAGPPWVAPDAAASNPRVAAARGAAPQTRLPHSAQGERWSQRRPAPPGPLRTLRLPSPLSCLSSSWSAGIRAVWHGAHCHAGH